MADQYSIPPPPPLRIGKFASRHEADLWISFILGCLHAGVHFSIDSADRILIAYRERGGPNA